MLFDAYNESSGFDNTAIKADFDVLYQFMNGKPLKEIDKIIYAVLLLFHYQKAMLFWELSAKKPELQAEAPAA